jgi:metallo-beta-lactamase class B
VKQVVAASLALALAAIGGSLVQAQTPETVDSLLAAGRDAAGNDYTAIFDTTCGAVRKSMIITSGEEPRPVPSNPATWHAEPIKVFDNLYFVGQTEYSAWAVTTSDGIIVMDAIFDYSAEDEIIGGLRKLGLDPAQIKYVIVSHAHSDHVGGARLLQDRGARIVMSAADWDLLERSNVSFAKPRRDVVASDGQTLTLGDTTLTMYITPGHTLGTISTLIPVKDGNARHLAAYWGGTAFNWARGSAASYITPERPAAFWFDTYAKSSQRFGEIAAKAGVDVILSNHTKYDQTPEKTTALKTRAPGTPHPYVVGAAAIRRFFAVGEQCGRAGVAAVASGESANGAR